MKLEEIQQGIQGSIQSLEAELQALKNEHPNAYIPAEPGKVNQSALMLPPEHVQKRELLKKCIAAQNDRLQTVATLIAGRVPTQAAIEKLRQLQVFKDAKSGADALKLITDAVEKNTGTAKTANNAALFTTPAQPAPAQSETTSAAQPAP